MKNIIALLLCALLLTGCARTAPDQSADIARLNREIADLRSQVEELQQRLTLLETGAVADWSLVGVPLTQGNGAEITFTATPTVYREGQLALLRVLLEGRTVAELYCDWDGSQYSAQVELDAADGYSYHLILSEPEGGQEHLELNSPEKPVDDRLVYLDSSLNAVCMLNVFEWHIQEEQLVLDAGTAEVVLPRLTASGEAAFCTAARLVLMLDGGELESRSLTVPEHEDGEIYVGVNGIAFAMPELEEESQLELWLEVTLSDGRVLTHGGSCWYVYEGELIQAVG